MSARNVVLSAVALFWLALAVLALVAANSAPTPRASPPAPIAKPARQADTLSGTSELARHAVRDDCWIMVRGKVYDVTRYIPMHPTAAAVITVHCGKDATWAFETKADNRAHSKRAWSMLDDYLVVRPARESIDAANAR
jgi:hypothetical protein